MKLKFDFYEKHKFSISIEGTWKTLNQQHSDLFIFTSYTLRQMWILDGHLIGNALAGAFVCSEYSKLGDILEIPDGAILLSYRDAFIQKSLGSQENWGNLTMAAGAKYSDNALVNGLNNVIFPKIPEIVKYKGDAKIQFIYYPELRKLDMKGLGILGTMLGKDSGYYGFWSTVELYRMLKNKHSGDKTFLDTLNKLAIACVYCQITNRLPQNQTAAAEQFIEGVLNQ